LFGERFGGHALGEVDSVNVGVFATEEDDVLRDSIEGGSGDHIG
jgi:hypothetical protein